MRMQIEIKKYKKRLLNLINNLAILHGKFILSSGIKSNYYIDLRRITLHQEASLLIGRILLYYLKQSGIKNFSSIGGLTMGADPVSISVMNAARENKNFPNVFIIRKEKKTYGAKKQIEGPPIYGQRVVLLDDIVTTGTSMLKAINIINKEKAKIIGSAVILDRGENIKNLIESKTNVPYITIFKKNELKIFQ